MDSREPNSPTPKTHLVVAWPAAAIGALVLAIAALATLAVLVNESQVLATVAIVLAIIAFVVQIIVFIVQMQVSGSQALHSQELHGQLEGVLVQIQERTEGTQESLVGMNEKLLEVAIGRSLPQARKASEGDDEGFVRDLAVATIQNLRGQDDGQRFVEDLPSDTLRRRRVQSTGSVWPTRPVTDEDRKAVAIASKWPSKEEAESVLSGVEQLSDADIARLVTIIEDDFAQLSDVERGKILVPGYSLTDADKILCDEGFISGSGYISPLAREIQSLTPLGRIAGRLVSIPAPVPLELQGDSRLARLRTVVPMTDGG